MTIERITVTNNKTFEAINKLLTSLTNNKQLSKERFDALILNTHTHLFIVYDTNYDSIGMLTLCTCDTTTGHKGWIEDVVVANELQGKGIGKALIEFSIDYAHRLNIDKLMLTSRPSRTYANKLYKKCGFTLKETNVYELSVS